MISRLKITLTTLLVMMFLSAPTIAGWDPNEEKKALDTVAAFKKNDSGLDAYFSKARGYVVYPSVVKGGIGIGGAHGKGVVFEAGKTIGTSTLTQISFGFQLGGQVYSEIVFFKDSAAMNNFKKGEIELSAQVSAVAVTEGVSAKTDFKDGIAIFTMAKGGLMYEATVAGQKLSFKKK